MTRLDRIRNKRIRGRIGVTDIADKTRKNKLRWFGYVGRKNNDEIVREIGEIRMRGKSKPKKKWTVFIREDMRERVV